MKNSRVIHETSIEDRCIVRVGTSDLNGTTREWVFEVVEHGVVLREEKSKERVRSRQFEFEIEVLTRPQILLESTHLSWWHMSVITEETRNDTGEHDWLVRLPKR